MFEFVAIQSPAGAAPVGRAGLEMDRVDTMLLFNEGMLHKDTATIFRIFHQLGWPRRLVWVAWIPLPVRDASYRFVARHRYRLLGGASITASVHLPKTKRDSSTTDDSTGVREGKWTYAFETDPDFQGVLR